MTVDVIITDIIKEYKRGTRVTRALDGVNLSIKSGELVAIVGPSGSGKTTLLSLIAGLLNPTAGSIVLGDRKLAELDDKELSHFRNNNIGLVPQGHSLLTNLTVWENVRLPFYLNKKTGNPDDRAEELLKELGIIHLKDEYPDTLSGGEIRRVAIARAMINDPRIILADEPTGDLDEENTREIIALFNRISKQGTTVLIVTHDLDSIEDIECVYKMNKGILTSEKSIKIA